MIPKQTGSLSLCQDFTLTAHLREGLAILAAIVRRKARFIDASLEALNRLVHDYLSTEE